MPEEEKSKSRSKSSSKSKDDKHRHSSKSKDASKPAETAAPSVVPVDAALMCENCREQRALSYCGVCDLLMCEECAEKIHQQPAFTSHALQPAAAEYLARAICRQHGERAIQYCESCEEFVCAKCVELAHEGVRHTLLPVQAAFAAKLGQIRLEIGVQLSPLRERLQRVFEQYKAQMLELQTHARSIEQYTLKEADGIVERLNSAVAARKSRVEPDFTHLASVIDEIDMLVSAVSATFPTGENQLELFGKIKDFQETIKAASALNVENLQAQIAQIDFNLPEEMQTLVSMRTETSQNTGVLKAKEAQIQILQDHLAKSQQTGLQEAQSWERLVGEYAEELRSVSMQCCFCGSKCVYEKVNSECSANPLCKKDTLEATQRSEKILERDEQMEVEEALEYVGTNRHYFVRCFK